MLSNIYIIAINTINKKKLITTDNIIIDSKSGYSGAGKNLKLDNIKNSNDLNFYNYKTNNHQHICEIKQELKRLIQMEILIFHLILIYYLYLEESCRLYTVILMKISQLKILKIVIIIIIPISFCKIKKDEENLIYLLSKY